MNNKSTKRLALMALLLMGATSTIFGQHAITRKVVSDGSGEGGEKTMTFSADDVFFIGGVGALVMAGENQVRVDFLPDANNRDKKYKDVDIRQGDVIMMVNGKRTKTIAKLREVFDKVEVGDEITLGIKRGKEMTVVSFAKSDNSPGGGGGQMMVMTTTTDEEGGHEGGPVTKTMTFGGPEGDIEIFPLMGFGVMLTDGDNQLKVMPKMQMGDMKSAPINLEENDLILSINGQSVSSTADFGPVYMAIPTGDKVTLKVKRGDETITVEVTKPEMGEGQIIRRETN